MPTNRDIEERVPDASADRNILFPIYWLGLSILVVAADYTSDPQIHFTSISLIPVALASWYSGKWWGIGLALSISIARWYLALMDPMEGTPTSIGINSANEMLIFSAVAYLIDRLSKQARALRKEVLVLSGLLPICMHCKKIRNGKNAWEPLEQYIQKRSEAEFSHGLCPECAKTHYPDFHRKS